MKRLSMGDWSVIARYLKKEANAEDEDRFAILVDCCPDLKDKMEEMERMLNVPISAYQENFNENTAFETLTARFKRENLI